MSSTRSRARGTCRVLAWLALASVSLPAGAIEPANAINGATLSPLWIIPFAGIVLSIALGPVTAPGFWQDHFGKTTAFWTLAFVVPFAVQFGPQLVVHEVVHTLLTEYLPFIILLVALFTVSGGIHIGGALRGSAACNTGLLAVGTVLASLMGTTGAAMLLIRPLLRANQARRHRAHVVVFFIFLVANIGGALTPLGDPPLFLGFLKGVDFFWTTRAMLLPTLTASTILLAAFFVLDRWLWRYEKAHAMLRAPAKGERTLRLDGTLNLVLLALVVGSVLLSGVWKSELGVTIAGARIELQDAVRDALLVGVAAASWRWTPRRVRQANDFSFAPMTEVAMLFAGIFLTIIPALAILRAGHDGVLAPLLALLAGTEGQPANDLYFWLTGVLSSVLDNAPTYLVFFNLAGGDAGALTGPLASTLTAISAGAVFMGANTYIGNAPNFMVKAIAESRGVRMPTFLGYLGWSMLVLMPIYALLTLLFF
ncbi:MAG TPA: sodium:proton antiporter [Casimicrobiaceae bacterium]